MTRPAPVVVDGDAVVVHSVRFEAPSTSSEPFTLSWGQERVLDLEDSMRPGHAQLNVRLAVPVRSGSTVDDALRAIARMVESCQSLRTKYARNPGETPVQRVECAGVLPVIEVGTARGEDQDAARDLANDLAAQPMSDDGWPLRVAIVSVAGQARQLVIAARHTAVDYFGLGPLLEALGGLVVTEPQDVRGQLAAPQPIDVVEWERGPRGRSAGARAMRRNIRTFDQMPASMVPRLPGAPDTPRYRYVRLDSPCLTHTLGRLARRHGVSETSVLYGALSVLLAHVGGLDRAHWQVCTANRLDRATASAVITLTQDTPTWIDLDDHDLAGVLERSSRALLDATLHGRFPHTELAPARAAVEERRGVALDCSYWLNSRLSGSRLVPPELTPEELGVLRDEARLAIEPGGDLTSTSTVFVYADRRDGTTTLRMLVDTAYVLPDEARGWLDALDALLLNAVRGETDTRALAAAVGLPTPPPDSEWALVDHSRIHLPTVLAVLHAAGAPVTSVRADAVADGRTVLVATATEVDEAVAVLRSARAREAIGAQRVAMLPYAVEGDAGARRVARALTAPSTAD